MDLDTPSQLAKLRLELGRLIEDLDRSELPAVLRLAEDALLADSRFRTAIGFGVELIDEENPAKASRRRTRGSRRSSSRSARRRPSARCYWAQKRLRIALPVPVRLQLVFELPTALAADVSFVVVRPPILSAVEVRIEDSVA